MPFRLNRHWPRVALLAILLAAFYLGTHALAAQSLWYDEAVTAQVAGRGLAELTRWTAGDIQPPLYYYVVAGWTWLTGRSEWALRFPSAFFAVLLAATCWLLARRLFGRGRVGAMAGLLAAGLAATSPLYVYYAQEARMYTLLTWLGALAGYCLLRADGAPDRGSSRRWWAAWAACSAAALYTHYFAAFLLLAQGLYFVVALAARRTRRTREGWQAAGAATLAVFLLYLPWLPAMLSRYQLDRSYWQGALKLGEALRHVAISFTAGAPETMLEGAAVRWLPWFGAAVVACAAALALRRDAPTRQLKSAPVTANPLNRIENRLRIPQHVIKAFSVSGGDFNRRASVTCANLMPLLYLLLTLLIPIVAVLALASRTPKFNPRYLMLASPAYVLILAGGVAALLDPLAAGLMDRARTGDHGGIAPTEALGGAVNPGGSRMAGREVIPWMAIRIGGALLAAAVLAPCSIVSATSIHNWFTDPAFSKAQWRELAAYVRKQIRPDEAVLLVSGHAWPAWDYYAPDLHAARLPDIDILDVNAVVGFDSAGELAQALAGKQGAWVVLWQDQAADPVGFVPYFLDRAGTETAQPREFWQLRLRHWTLRPGATFASHPQPQHADGANYGHKIALLGWDEPAGGQITLYWQALNTLGSHDYQVSLAWEDAAGRATGARWDGRPAGYLYPTDRWQPGAPLFGRYDVPKELPAGDYYVTIAVYDTSDPSGLDVMDVADNPAGKRVKIGPVNIER